LVVLIQLMSPKHMLLQKDAPSKRKVDFEGDISIRPRIKSQRLRLSEANVLQPICNKFFICWRAKGKSIISSKQSGQNCASYH
jgi:hypothetical protein